MSKEFDVVIIGAGPGGYVAAIRAAQLGLNVAVAEKEHLGGICLNWGCIPTKALLRSAEIYHYMKHAEDFGLKASGVDFDLKKIIARSRGVSAQLNKGIGHLLKKNKVTHLEGHASFLDKKTLEIEKDGKKEKISAKNIIIATGARARELPHIPVDGKNIWTYKHALTPEKMPKSIIVIGSGAIGVEFASFYNALGAKVTIVEMVDRIMPVEDKEISGLAEKSFKAQGIDILTTSSVEKVNITDNQVTASVKNLKNNKTQELSAEKVISAVGIIGNTESLGLEKAHVKVDRGHIVTNAYCETNTPNIYAIGDVTSGPWLAHKASHEAITVIDKIAGKKAHPMDVTNIAGCTYSHPQVASVGLTEDKAKEMGHTIKVGRFPFIGNGKAIAMGETEGMIKTIFDQKTGALLGAHMIGAEVTEMIQGFVIARQLETTEEELMHTIFPHPTMSEAMHESVLDAFDRAIHI